MVVLAVAVTALAAGPATAAPAASPQDPARVTIAVVPHRTTVAELGRVPGMGVGLLSAGIGPVPAEQTFLDVGQGARLAPSLYDEPLPPLSDWAAVRKRAADAPADIVPGLLGSALARAGISVRAQRGAGDAAAMVVDESGRVNAMPGCPRRGCSGVSVVEGRLADLQHLARALRGDDLLIAIERPPPTANHGLSFGIAGAGFDGTLTSDSTRMRGYVVSTDIAPTILERLGISIPSEIDGEQIHTDGAVDTAYVQSLANRLAVVGPRRGPVIGTSLLIWVGLCALSGIVFGARGLRCGLPVLAVTLAYVPAVLLATAALGPSETVERLIVAVGTPLLAGATLRLVPALGALAIAGAVSVAGYAVDVIAGSHLTELSLIGPNPAEGVRFFGIGNELEAVVSALVPIATGAALATWAPTAAPRNAALAFAATGLAAVAAFAPGQFGADVGAAVGIPIGMAVAIAISLGATTFENRRAWWAVIVVAAPLIAVAALIGADLVSGGNAHLTRSVLHAGGLDHFGDVVERRLRLSAHSFDRYAGTPLLWLAAVGIVAGIAGRRRLRAWFGERRFAWGGFLGAAAATAAGTLANDSGALLLIIGTLLCGAAAAVAWATHVPGMCRNARTSAFSSGNLRRGSVS